MVVVVVNEDMRVCVGVNWGFGDSWGCVGMMVASDGMDGDGFFVDERGEWRGYNI